MYGEDEVLARIDDATILVGSLARTAARLVKEWAEMCQPELLSDWVRAQVSTPLVPIEPLRQPGSMSRPARVVDVEYLGDYRLRLTFSDNLARDSTSRGVLGGELFEPLRDQTVFAQVSGDTVAGTISGTTAWPRP